MKKIEGIDVARVSAEVVVAELRRRRLSVSGTIEEQLGRLARAVKATTPRSKLADCSTCGGESSTDDKRCPYCGDGEVDLDSAAPIVPGAAGTIAPSGEHLLNEAVARIQALKVKAFTNYWQLGRELIDVETRGLWKHRVTERGVGAYKTWTQFCEVELGFAPQYVYRLIDVAKRFTEADVQRIGTSKLMIMLRLPASEEKRLLPAAAAKTTAEVRDEVAQRALPGKRQTGRTAKGGAGTHKPGAKAGGKKADPSKTKVTVASLFGRVEIPLVKAGTKRPARALTDSPSGEETLLNGTVQTYLLTRNDDGQLVLVVERRRA